MEFQELQKIVESNSKAIQAMLEAQTTDRLKHEEFKERTEATITRLDNAIQRLTTLNEGVVNLLSALDSDRPTIMRKLSTIENKVDRLLERGDQVQS